MGIDGGPVLGRPAQAGDHSEPREDWQAPFRAPALSLPKGGGAIRGIGERFAAHPVTGSATCSIPLPLSPGRAGVAPQLSLGYDSGAGNGPFGFGWTLDLPAITAGHQWSINGRDGTLPLEFHRPTRWRERRRPAQNGAQKDRGNL